MIAQESSQTLQQIKIMGCHLYAFADAKHACQHLKAHPQNVK